MSTYQEESIKTETQCKSNNCSVQPTEQPNRIPFWSNDPNILLNQQYIFEFFPTENMTYEQKLNAISRLIILLSILGFIATYNMRIPIILVITLFAIYMMYTYHIQKIEKFSSKKAVETTTAPTVENFEGPGLAALQQNNLPVSTDVFDKTNSDNPFTNVLMTDYDYNPNKKPAPPASNEMVSNNILSSAKQLVQNANPDDPNIANKLFKDLGDQLVFEQSLRQFYSNPSTTIPNDQSGFAEFCYGSMISCKEGNMFACARNLSRHTNQ